MTYLEFKNEVLGHGYDLDGLYGNQCVDGAVLYCQKLGVPPVYCNATGYAHDWWTQRETNGMLNYWDEVTELQPGDLVIFHEHPSTPLSHVAIFDHDVDGVNGCFLGQNQGGPNGAFNLINLPYEATYPTAFRIKGSAPEPSIESHPKEKEFLIGSIGAVYRFYNRFNGDHLYTTDVQEALKLFNGAWDYEGIAWTSPTKGDVVYRLVNPQSGIHHFTLNPDEIEGLTEMGWTKEGAAFMSGGSHPVYRLYNPNGGEHVLTASRGEHDGLVCAGWYCEGQDLKY